MIQTRDVQLHLDVRPAGLCSSHIQPGSVVCNDPALAEGVNFEIDHERGTATALHYLGEEYERKLIGFSFSYDDRAEELAAVEAQRQADIQAIGTADPPSPEWRAAWMRYHGIEGMSMDSPKG